MEGAGRFSRLGSLCATGNAPSGKARSGRMMNAPFRRRSPEMRVHIATPARRAKPNTDRHEAVTESSN